MFDCADDVLAHHDEKVTLPQAERTAMHDRRNANRDRLKRGLKDAQKPAPREFVSQGSYAMRTMVQHSQKDYDLDDGVYFSKESLVGDRGGEMSALQARQMVRDAALDDGSFKTAPEVRKNCVRVYYDAGVHVDVPAYRRVTTKDILGRNPVITSTASSEWKRSDARDVTGLVRKTEQREKPGYGQWAPASAYRPADQEISAQPGKLEKPDAERIRHHEAGHGVLPQQRKPQKTPPCMTQ